MRNFKHILILLVLLFQGSVIALEKTYDVVAIGKAMVDVVSFVSDEELKSIMPAGFRKADSNKISAQDADNFFKRLNQYEIIPGGSEANVIVDIASLGGKTAFNTIAANDKFGLMFRESLTKEKVAYLSKLSYYSDKSTALCFTFITPDKDRTFAVSADLTYEMNESYINFDSIKQSKVFYTDSSNIDDGGVRSKIINKAFSIAKENSTTIAFNLNNKYYIEKHRDEIIKLLQEVDILFAGISEAELLFKVGTLDEVISEGLRYAKTLVITMGKAGAIIVNKNQRIYIPTQGEQDKIVDLNGAGDAFAAGFLYGITQGYDYKKSGEIAAKTASVIITQVGARPKTKLSEELGSLANN